VKEGISTESFDELQLVSKSLLKLKEVHLQEFGAAQAEFRGKVSEMKNKDREVKNHCSFAMEVAAGMGYQLGIVTQRLNKSLSLGFKYLE